MVTTPTEARARVRDKAAHPTTNKDQIVLSKTYHCIEKFVKVYLEYLK
jgi:hypothetical protein